MDMVGALFIGMAGVDYIKEEVRKKKNKKIRAFNNMISEKQADISQDQLSFNNYTGNAELNSYRNNVNRQTTDKLDKLERSKLEYE